MKQYFLLSAAVLALSSCVNDLYEGQDIAGEKLVVTGGINQIESRVSGTSWDKGDKIGVSCAEAGHDNVLYVTSEGNGQFSTEEPVYVLGANEFTYTAYYPYSETVSAENAEISFSVPQDYLWASATVIRDNPDAAFQFQHKMSKISITIEGNEGEGGSGAIHLKNVYTDGKFNTLTGEVTSPSTRGTLSSEFTLGTPAAFILPPVQSSTEAISVLVEYNGKAYGGEITLASLAENTEYQYTIDISTTEPGKQLSISSPTIADWGDKIDNGSIAVTEEKLPNVLEVGDFLLADGRVIDKNDADFESEKDNVRGVVYFVGNSKPSELYGYNTNMDILASDCRGYCENGLAIAIDNANNGDAARFATAKYDFSKWYKSADVAGSYIDTNLNLTNLGERMLGYNNTKLIAVASATINDDSQTGVSETLSIVETFNESNSVDNASTWYIPSYAELKAVIDNYETVRTSIEKAGGALPQYADFGTTDTNTGNFYWTSDLRGSSYTWGSPMCVPSEGVELYLSRNSSGTKGFFRLSIAF